MNRHSFRWSGLVFGLLLLAVAGGWAVWDQDLLSDQQFSFTVSAVLVVVGVAGVVSTFWRPTHTGHTPAPTIDPTPNTSPSPTSPSPTSPSPSTEEESHEQAADPQP